MRLHWLCTTLSETVCGTRQGYIQVLLRCMPMLAMLVLVLL